MNLNNKGKAYFETGITTLVMTIFSLIGLLTFPIINLVYPIPFVVLGLRNGLKYSVSAFLLSSLAVSGAVYIITGAVLFVAYIFIPFGLLGFLLVYTIQRGYKNHEVFVGGFLIYFFSTILMLVLIQNIEGIKLISSMESLFDESLQLQLSMIGDMGLSNLEISQMKELFTTTASYILSIVPSLLIISSIVIVYVNHLLGSYLAKKTGVAYVNVPRTKYFRLPNNILLGTAIIFIGGMLSRYLQIFNPQLIMRNIVSLAVFIFFIQGLAVILFFTGRLKMNKVVRGIIVILMIIYLSIFISIIGLFDAIFNFRKIKGHI